MDALRGRARVDNCLDFVVDCEAEPGLSVAHCVIAAEEIDGLPALVGAEKNGSG